MKLSGNAWHRKYLEFAYGEYFVRSELSHSLCPYFWALVGAVLLAPIIVLIRGVERMLPTDYKWLAHFSPLALSLAATGVLIAWWIPFVVVGAIVGLFGIALGIIKLIETINDRRTPKPKRERTERGPSMTMEFIKAKKNKYCPRIEWID